MEKKTFEIKEEHLNLLESMFVDFDENTGFGVPIINPKRPYGNSDVYGDMAEILNIKPKEDGKFSEDQIKYMDRIHKETQTALQIVLRIRKIQPGIYESDKYVTNWKLR